MKLRNLLAVAAGTAGLTALANRLITRRGSGFDQFLDGDTGTYRWRGFDVRYVEAGDPANEDLVLVHGINAAASNHEFHAVFEELATEYHVLAPDLPGFGHSDRPPIRYTDSVYSQFLTDFLADETGDPTVVASSLSGSYATIAADRTDVDRLVLVCPTAETMGSRRQWRRAVLRSPILGQAIYNAVVSKPSLKHFHEDHGYHDLRNLTDDVLDYEWLTAHQAGARFAPASFVTGFLDPNVDLAECLGELSSDVTLVWGREAKISPVGDGKAIASAADARLLVFDAAKLLPHVEHPAQFVDVVRGEYEPPAQ
jgi:pimeloyl-ACP methyl ester carboxylesterase